MKVLDKIEMDIPKDIGKDFLTKLMGGRLNPKLEKILEEKKQQCIENIEPKAIYDKFKIEKIEDHTVYFGTKNTFKGPNIAKILTGSEIALIFVFTLGGKVDKIIKETTKSGDTLSTIVMDTITTSLLTLLGKHFTEIAKKEGKEKDSWNATCTYSPGQYKWTIEEQKEIFKMLPADKIGVKLNPSYLMVPFKSVSGVYGFGPENKIDKTKVACELCPRENCISRRN
ncbi:MAG: vitamin B12 dependent-methionine synthase activation domain-containing protein [Actinomycetota bacterium]